MNEELSEYSGIYQNFESDIYKNLNIGNKYLNKYTKMILLFPERQPLGMRKGFIKFCKEHSFNYEVIDSLKEKSVEKGEGYIIPDDRNLIRIMK
jgi:hypothetical protein